MVAATPPIANLIDAHVALNLRKDACQLLTEMHYRECALYLAGDESRTAREVRSQMQRLNCAREMIYQSHPDWVMPEKMSLKDACKKLDISEDADQLTVDLAFSGHAHCAQPVAQSVLWSADAEGLEKKIYEKTTREKHLRIALFSAKIEADVEIAWLQMAYDKIYQAHVGWKKWVPIALPETPITEPFAFNLTNRIGVECDCKQKILFAIANQSLSEREKSEQFARAIVEKELYYQQHPDWTMPQKMSLQEAFDLIGLPMDSDKVDIDCKHERLGTVYQVNEPFFNCFFQAHAEKEKIPLESQADYIKQRIWAKRVLCLVMIDEAHIAYEIIYAAHPGWEKPKPIVLDDKTQ